METYTLNPTAFKAVRMKMYLRYIPLLFVALAAGLSFSYLGSQNSAGSISTLPLMIIMVLLVFAFSLYTGHKRLKQLFESYILTFSEDVVIRELIFPKSFPLVNYLHDLREDIVDLLVKPMVIDSKTNSTKSQLPE
jgi:hypothetical protein